MPQTANRSMSLSTWGLLLLLGLIWGGSFFFGRIAVQHVPPMTLVLFRVSLAAIALHLAFGRMPGFYQTLVSRWRELLVIGLINNAIPFTLIFAGQTRDRFGPRLDLQRHHPALGGAGGAGVHHRRKDHRRPS
jgi:drug/metabolite transporter (DMT)-like permease